MLEEITQPNYKSFMFPRLSNCQKSHIDSIIVFQNLKKKNYLSNWGLCVACFKCKPACVVHPHRSSDSMLKLEDWSICQRQKKKKKKSPDLIRKKQMKLYLKQVKWSHPGSTHVFLFLLQTKLIIEHHFGSSFGCLCAHGRDSFSPTWISWRAWTSRRFFQASTGCPPSSGFFQVGRIAYSYNLQPGSVETYFYNLYYFI